MAPRLGLLLGSARPGGNTEGISSWLTQLISSSTSFETHVLHPSDPIYPSAPLVGTMPALITDPAQYERPETKQFSEWVSSCSALAILTPQYNHSVPGGLKNALDHIFWEWKGKPFLVVTFGGHAGAMAGAHLREIIEGGVRAKVIANVPITLPRPYINGDERVGKQPQAAPGDSFLDDYVEQIKDAAKRLEETLPQ